jgi:hypothetical protein
MGLRIFRGQIDFRLRPRRVSKPLRSDVSRQQTRCLNDLQGPTSPNSATAFDIRPDIGLKPNHLAHRRAHSGCDPEGGVRAVPAGGLANRSRAASGIMSTGITAGARGAAAGLGQASAGNARKLPRPRKPGLESKSRGLETTARAAVERREASAPEADDPCKRMVRGARRARSADGWRHLFVWCGRFRLRLPALRLPLFIWRRNISGFRSCRKTRVRSAPRERDRSYLPPPLSRGRMIGYALDCATATGDAPCTPTKT